MKTAFHLITLCQIIMSTVFVIVMIGRYFVHNEVNFTHFLIALSILVHGIIIAIYIDKYTKDYPQ